MNWKVYIGKSNTVLQSKLQGNDRIISTAPQEEKGTDLLWRVWDKDTPVIWKVRIHKPQIMTDEVTMERVADFALPITDPYVTEQSVITSRADVSNNYYGLSDPCVFMSESDFATHSSNTWISQQAFNLLNDRSVMETHSAAMSDFMIPKVAPFIIMNGLDNRNGIDDYYLHLKIGSFSSSYHINKDITTIGRPDDETNNFPDIEIDLDSSVSRRHAEIQRINGEFYIVDLGSTNGTRLNGTLLDIDNARQLSNGDNIQIGNRVRIVFEAA